MAKIGRPATNYHITRVCVGDPIFSQTFTVRGARGVAEILGIAESDAYTVLRILGGEFTRLVTKSDGYVYEERVKRVA